MNMRFKVWGWIPVIVTLCMIHVPSAGAHEFSGTKLSEGDIRPPASTNIQSSLKPAYSSTHITSGTQATKATARTAIHRTPKPLQYKVSSGDTLYRIARKFGVTVEAIQTANRLVNPNALTIGKPLAIPARGTTPETLLSGTKVVRKVFMAKLTAYTAGYESTGKKPSHPAYGITSSGAKVKEGRTIAVDPRVIPIGTTVYIEGIGLRQAEDTGSAIKGARIDVFIQDLKQARKFGVKKDVKVYVLAGSTDVAAL
ncbi:3D domain-containing protein [Paenibacillus swuensis]|uniref:3D domain-containing protein n=1 Tax=Paenibacillus swuensis TaxID=1178515 RepID=UPI000838D5E0